MYATIVLLFNLPVMQRKLADWTSDVLSEQMKSKVEIENINLGFLNNVIVNDITVYEPDGKKMLTVARMSASINLLSLANNKIDINTAQLFGVKAVLYKETPTSKPNYQFIIDAFKSDEEKETKINLRLNSFIMRHASITYDIMSEPSHPHSIDKNHISLKDCGMNLSLKCLTNDSINCTVRRLQLKEANSGVAIHNTQLSLVGNTREMMLSNLLCEIGNSNLKIDSLYAFYGEYEKSKKFSFKCSPITAIVVPSDFVFVNHKLSAFDFPINIELEANGNEKKIVVDNLSANTDDNTIVLASEVVILNVLNKDDRKIDAKISQFIAENSITSQLVSTVTNDEKTQRLVSSIGDISYKGDIAYSASMIASNGKLMTKAGDAEYDVSYSSNKRIEGTLTADSLQIGIIADNDKLGAASFDIDFDVDLSNTQTLPSGFAKGTVYGFAYNGYEYHNVNFDVSSQNNKVKGNVDIDDENMKLTADMTYDNHIQKDIQLLLDVNNINPYNLKLVNDYAGDEISFVAKADLHGKDFKHLFGGFDVENMNIITPSTTYAVNNINVQALRDDSGSNRYVINSDIASGVVNGDVDMFDVFGSFSNQLALHMPILVKKTEANPADFTYNLTLNDNPLLHHFIKTDFALNSPVCVKGDVRSASNEMTLHLTSPSISYNGNNYDSIFVDCKSTAKCLNVSLAAENVKYGKYDDEPTTTTRLNVSSAIHDNTFDSKVALRVNGSNNINVQLLPVVNLRDSLGVMKTDITINRSKAILNDTTWTVSPSRLSFYKKSIECDKLRFSNDNTNSYIAINGNASNNPNDSIVATLNNIEIGYITQLINFTNIDISGKASGRASLNNVIGGGIPNFKAILDVEDLALNHGPLGHAKISANWDDDVDGIAMKGRIVDVYDTPDALTDNIKRMTGVTTINGWISPSKNDMRLDVGVFNTNAAFLKGFLGGVFKEITGSVTGGLAIVGPFNDVNIIGDAVPNMNLRLKATNVPYHIEGDTLRIREHLFEFKNISMYDRFGHRSIVNGTVTHHNMKNFKYDFDADLRNMLAYDETKFNSDKFLATVFADGVLSIHGKDGHPLYVDADVTTAKGSVFAYDAATPDAITGNSFIEFRNRDSIRIDLNKAIVSIQYETQDSLAIVKKAKRNYKSDIYINFNINLTPNCEVKLRMDNLEDGYMRTYGNAKLTAKWYNKGAFQLFGNYDIQSGSYRLYLQDIIFRDLAIQPGSNVEFNGNPFDANIHLICHHQINSVPLSDLTATTAFSQNNKVKVKCILDITGKLGNMDFKFGMDMPNVSEEVKQLVNSMINSEEEMNTQMIYLLGFGRFFPNEFARANGTGNNASQAANSLLSSTISGQINQVLSNIIGNNPNWNFGSSLTTGENGWDDLDVEGMLSGKLLDERLLIDGNFGYRDNALTKQANFIGDFEVKWRLTPKGELYLKGYNQTNDRYFTKSTLNTQGIGISWKHDFEAIRERLRKKKEE